MNNTVIGECLRASVEGPFFVWFLKAPESAEADAVWRAKSSRHLIVSADRVKRYSQEDWSEFHTLLGLTRDEVAQIAKAWPNCEGEEVDIAINNAMNNLLGYPHRCEDVWHNYISVSKVELEQIYKDWKTSQ